MSSMRILECGHWEMIKYEDGGFVNGISALKERPQRAPFPL